jgi:hypothetical protein
MDKGTDRNASSMAPGRFSPSTARSTAAWKRCFSYLPPFFARSWDTMSLCRAKRSGKGPRTLQQPAHLKYAMVVQAGQGRVNLGIGQRKSFPPQESQRRCGCFGLGDGQPQRLGHRLRFGRPFRASQLTFPLLAVAVVELVGVKAKPIGIATLQHAPGRADEGLELPSGVVFQVGEKHHQGW